MLDRPNERETGEKAPPDSGFGPQNIAAWLRGDVEAAQFREIADVTAAAPAGADNVQPDTVVRARHGARRHRGARRVGAKREKRIPTSSLTDPAGLSGGKMKSY